jgi:hypothetical protein
MPCLLDYLRARVLLCGSARAFRHSKLAERIFGTGIVRAKPIPSAASSPRWTSLSCHGHRAGEIQVVQQKKKTNNSF